MRTHPKLTKKNLETLYVHRGLSMEKVASRIGASKHGVLNALHRFGIPARAKGNPRLTEKNLIAFYVDQKLSTLETAKKLGVSDAGVYAALRRHGIQLRGKSKAAKLQRGYTHLNWRLLAGKYRAGEPLDAIAEEAGCCLSTASKYLSEHTAVRSRGSETNRPNSRGRIDIDVDKAIAMNLEGATLTEIGAKFGVSVQIVSKRLRDAGYKVITHKASKDKFKNIQARKRTVAHAIGANKCTICHEKRGVQLCHIQARRYGGELIPDNVIALCPSHHWFFDQGCLSDKEISRLKPSLAGPARKGYKHHYYEVQV